MSKKLTRELIAQKAKSDRIQNIKNLNLWGSNLDDISIISEMPSLEIVSLSVNKIRTLKPFANCPNLRELYLRNNLIADLKEIMYLADCENLKILWLSENPICDIKNYRAKVISILPQIAKLDDVMVTDAEKEGEIDTNIQQEEEEDNNEQRYQSEEEEKDEPYQNYQQKNQMKVENRYRTNQDEDNTRYQSKYNKYNDDDDNEEDTVMPLRKAPTYNYNKPNVKQSYSKNDPYEEDYYQPPKPKIKRLQTAQVRGYQPPQSEYQMRNKFSKGKDSYILQSVLLLLNELNRNELKTVQREIDNMNKEY